VREGLEILIEPYHAVSLERVESVHPSHIILSGQSHPWTDTLLRSWPG